MLEVDDNDFAMSKFASETSHQKYFVNSHDVFIPIFFGKIHAVYLSSGVKFKKCWPSIGTISSYIQIN